jgi:hypothetical protein
MSLTIVSTDRKDLGICLIHTYREAGDLYDNWDYVQQRPDGSFERAPDARYGSDAPEGEHHIEDFQPMHLIEVYQVLDRNGHGERETRIETIDGELIASRTD